VIYLDTSALVKLYLLEADSGIVQALISAQDAPIPLWELQEMELTNALRLKVFWGDISEADANHQLELLEQRKARGHYYFPDVDRVALFNKFRNLSLHTQQIGCRTLDILHVACACILGPDLFVSFDARQRHLAQVAGLNVYMPD
jgi:predicted nucleic acid-binding protein